MLLGLSGEDIKSREVISSFLDSRGFIRMSIEEEVIRLAKIIYEVRDEYFRDEQKKQFILSEYAMTTQQMLINTKAFCHAQSLNYFLDRIGRELTSEQNYYIFDLEDDQDFDYVWLRGGNVIHVNGPRIGKPAPIARDKIISTSSSIDAIGTIIDSMVSA